jgi:hypothetical protein
MEEEMEAESTSQDGRITKEVKYLDGTIQKHFKVTCPEDVCVAKNCTKRGRIMVLPILSKHDPFWLCNTHYKRFKRSIFKQRKEWKIKSQGHELMWVRNDAEVVPREMASMFKLNTTKPKPTSIHVGSLISLGKPVYNEDFDDVPAIHQDDEIYLPLSWLNSIHILDSVITINEQEDMDDTEVRDNPNDGD